MRPDAPRLATVVSVRGRDRDALLADPDFVYVGRGVYRGRKPWYPSIWANPFRVGMKRDRAVAILGRDIDASPRVTTIDTPRLAIRFYGHWIQEPAQRPLVDRLHELVGAKLGCWCGSWEPGRRRIDCHAFLLAGMTNAALHGRDYEAGLPESRAAATKEVRLP